MRPCRGMLVLTVLAVAACRGDAPRRAPPVPVASGVPVAPVVPDAAVRAATWYRAVIRSADGTEVPFFLGFDPAAHGGEAIFKAGSHEVRTGATFDGETLDAPMAVHQTAVHGSVGPTGTLSGTFSTSWKSWGASSLPFEAHLVSAPALGALDPLMPLPGQPAEPPLDLGEPRTVWRIAMAESGAGRLVLTQHAPGELEGVIAFDTGNRVDLAGTARGHRVALTGFDGTAGYRLELDLDAASTHARGHWIAGHRLDWREDFTARRGPDFELAEKTKAASKRAVITLPDLPELRALPAGPLVVELAGSWCSTCRSAAPFLVALERDYHARGLQMVTLLYELTGDPATDAKQVATFRQTYGVTWPVVAVPGDVDHFAEIIPGGLRDVDPGGFPMMLFLAADRTLVGLHAGFPGATDTVDRAHAEATIRATVDRLLGAPLR